MKRGWDLGITKPGAPHRRHIIRRGTKPCLSGGETDNDRSLHVVLRGLNLGSADAKGLQEALSRRKIFTRAMGVAASVAAVGAIGSSASAATGGTALAQGTTIEQGAVAPTVVLLTDATTIAVDASLGNDYRVTIAASRTMGNPSNAVDGQQMIFQITQGTPGSSMIAWGSGYEFSTGLPEPTLSTSAGQTDVLGFVYNAAKGKWLLAAFVNGFS
jgi:hypothetical protein